MGASENRPGPATELTRIKIARMKREREIHIAKIEARARGREKAAEELGDGPSKEEQVGKVTHYLAKIGVAGIDVTAVLSVGETIHIKGHTSDFTQVIQSMQIDGQDVRQVQPGKSIGLKVTEHAREHDVVYKVTDR